MVLVKAILIPHFVKEAEFGGFHLPEFIKYFVAP
jgi:hypothetical protein